MRNRAAGFTLIELLIVVAIIAIIAVIAVPNLMHGMQVARQKRTVADMNQLSKAVEQYQIDNTHYPQQSTQGPVAGVVSGSLEPLYFKVTPATDAWNGQLMYGSSANGSNYTIRSFGKNGTADPSYGATHYFDCDIVIQDGSFTAYPEGAQS